MDTLNALFLATDRITQLRRQAEVERLAAAGRRPKPVPERRDVRRAPQAAMAEPCR